MSGPIRVMIVDDSQTTREMLADFFARDASIEVVATSSDPLAARHDFLTKEPDVLLLDVVMPHMSGLEFLEKVMSFRPLPIIIYTGRSQPELVHDAMQRGAWAVVHKPTGDSGERFHDVAGRLVSLIKQTGGHLSPSGTHPKVSQPLIRPHQTPPPQPTVHPRMLDDSLTRRIIAIGASTGGPQAIQTILSELPDLMPPIVIAIHMPPRFTRSYAQRLAQEVPLHVREAGDGETLRPGEVVIAPGNQHLTIVGQPGAWRTKLDERPPHRYHRPSIDWLLSSVAAVAPNSALGIILTGMGSDGVEGLRQLKDQGNHTIAQDEASSMVWGMPGEAVKRGVAQRVLPLDHIAQACLLWSRSSAHARTINS